MTYVTKPKGTWLSKFPSSSYNLGCAVERGILWTAQAQRQSHVDGSFLAFYSR